jgi:hypothetical protein
MSTSPANEAATAANTAALVGFILGIVTAIAVLLRPYWLITDALGVAAIVLGLVGLRVASQSGAGRRFAVWAVVLGLTPLVPLVLAWAVRLDYY